MEKFSFDSFIHSWMSAKYNGMINWKVGVCAVSLSQKNIYHRQRLIAHNS